ncbi:hypothetical protein QMK19_35195 [Streptomyces sp. H10-C2]|uniref:hypothetical protein n=1 Tax=unclassified Streptomyces TaxID=2593676 RepID=UPI0024B9792B|nr:MULTISPECIES: hypothetical protein [unclassified Streptomyces]MDJ0345881.1 hypothetical protein [Streptomyces sp. PH10-H1]MDJ0374730.1 hypothetical protein [Streptomyces sp. H10-C2]
MAHEIRISISDEDYEQLRQVAAGRHLPAEQYAQGVLAQDLAYNRFMAAGAAFITEHGAAFAERFGPRPVDGRADAA